MDAINTLEGVDIPHRGTATIREFNLILYLN